MGMATVDVEVIQVRDVAMVTGLAATAIGLVATATNLEEAVLDVQTEKESYMEDQPMDAYTHLDQTRKKDSSAQII